MKLIRQQIHDQIQNEKDCVVEHNIKNTNVFFCLNCNDWGKVKTAVFDQGWSLFNEDGFLRHDI